MKIGIANDHAATKMKFELIDYLTSKGHEVVNYGFDTEDSCDYPIAGEKLANGIMNGECEKVLPSVVQVLASQLPATK